MDKKDILVHGWEYAFDVEDWYPPIKAALQDVDFTEAVWKPTGKATHTIAELVTHLLYYKERFLVRLKGQEWKIPITNNDESFHTTDVGTAEAWKAAVDKLFSVQKEIKSILVTMDEAGLQKEIEKIPVERQILSLMMHDAYHTGQIILIRKLYGSWPEKRDV